MKKVTLNSRQMLSPTGGGFPSMTAGASFFQSFVGKIEAARSSRVRCNTMGFRTVQCCGHFDSLRHGAIICDSASRAVHFRSEEETNDLIYSCSVPMTEEFTHRSRTEIGLQRMKQTWNQTPSIWKRSPTLPDVLPPGPDNPMRTRALNLSWQYFRIHGIADEGKVGRRASNGFFGLFNHPVQELCELFRVGTQVAVQ